MIVLPPMQAQSLPPQVRRAIDSVFGEWDVPGHPGGYVAVLRGDTVLHLKAYGSPCLEHELAWREDHRLRIYSLTMAFVATVVLMLVDEGVLALDQNLRAHLPEMPDYDRPISIGHLLDHSSGLRDNESVQFVAGFVRTSPCSIEYAFELITRQQQPNFEPGAEVQFSNTNYRLLAIIVERVTGQPFGQVLQDRIFGPLRMSDSLLLPSEVVMVPRMVFGYTKLGRGGYMHLRQAAHTTGDGGIVSSIRDLVTWFQALRSNRLGIDRWVARLSECRTLSNGRKSQYGLGVRVGDQLGQRFMGHGGESPGYCAEFVHFLDGDLTVVIAANHFQASLERRVHEVAGVVLANGARAAPQLRRAPPQTDALALLGWYANADLPLVIKVDRPAGVEFEAEVLISAGMGGFVRQPDGCYDSPAGYSSVRARFVERPGRRAEMVLYRGVSELVFQPVSAEFLSVERMADYEGLFGSAELNAIHRVYAVDGQLLHLRGLGEWPEEQVRELIMVGADLFVLDYPFDLFTTVLFRRNRQGKVVGLLVANRDVTGIELHRLPEAISAVTATRPSRARIQKAFDV